MEDSELIKVTKNQIKFYKTQNKILIIGGVLSISLISLYKFNSLFVLSGLMIITLTFLICHIREVINKGK